MKLPGADQTQVCRKCNEEVKCGGAVGFTNEGTPIASVYEEHYHCECGHSWCYKPYAKGD